MERDVLFQHFRHDIRTRMTCIYNAVEILERMDLGDEQRWCIETMKFEAEALLGLVNELASVYTTLSEDISDRKN